MIAAASVPVASLAVILVANRRPDAALLTAGDDHAPANDSAA